MHSVDAPAVLAGWCDPLGAGVLLSLPQSRLPHCSCLQCRAATTGTTCTSKSGDPNCAYCDEVTTCVCGAVAPCSEACRPAYRFVLAQLARPSPAAAGFMTGSNGMLLPTPNSCRSTASSAKPALNSTRASRRAARGIGNMGPQSQQVCCGRRATRQSSLTATPPGPLRLVQCQRMLWNTVAGCQALSKNSQCRTCTPGTTACQASCSGQQCALPSWWAAKSKRTIQGCPGPSRCPSRCPAHLQMVPAPSA